MEKNQVQIAALPLTSSVTWSSSLSPLSPIVFIGSEEVRVTSLQVVLKAENSQPMASPESESGNRERHEIFSMEGEASR